MDCSPTPSTAPHPPTKMPDSPMLTVLLIVLLVFASPAKALPKRIVSVNLCTDGLLLTLAPKQHIAAVSRYASDNNRSPFTELAKEVPAVSVQAEAVLALKPDLVIAGKYGARETIKQLQRLGIPVEKFAPVQNFAELEQQIARLGNLIGEPERAQDLIAQIRQLDNSMPPVSSKIRGVIYFGSGVSPGSNTMEGRVLELAGIENITATPLRKGIVHLPLEEFIVAKPDVLVLTDYHQNTPSRAQRFQHHPVFRRMQQSTVVLPANLLTCGGGSWTMEAVNRLRAFTAKSYPAKEGL